MSKPRFSNFSIVSNKRVLEKLAFILSPVTSTPKETINCTSLFLELDLGSSKRRY